MIKSSKSTSNPSISTYFKQLRENNGNNWVINFSINQQNNISQAIAAYGGNHFIINDVAYDRNGHIAKDMKSLHWTGEKMPNLSRFWDFYQAINNGSIK